jgi:CubicO group peptidase (beta-lactamase class C family)
MEPTDLDVPADCSRRSVPNSSSSESPATSRLAPTSTVSTSSWPGSTGWIDDGRAAASADDGTEAAAQALGKITDDVHDVRANLQKVAQVIHATARAIALPRRSPSSWPRPDHPEGSHRRDAAPRPSTREEPMTPRRIALASLLVVTAALVPVGLCAQTPAATPAPKPGTTLTVPSGRSAADSGVSAQALQGAVAPHVKELVVDQRRLQTHVMRPPHIIGVLSDTGREAGPLEFKPIKPFVLTPAGPHLDVNTFGPALHNALKDQVAGYAMRLQKHGQTIYTLQWNWARTPPDGGVGWTPQRLMHVASVSKLVTAIAMTRLLREKNHSPDTKIIDYLPSYWPKGPNIDKITFRHLLTHTSGFAEGDTDYEAMKGAVATGVSTNPGAADHLGHYHYRNMNFGLCRILIAVMNGNIAKGASFTLPPPLPNLNDQIWDAVTIGAYDQYVRGKVFAPAGVTTATLDHPAAGVLAYKFPVSTAGWNSGGLASVSGGAGWHMSIDQLLVVMGTFRRKGTIMPPSAAQTMLDDGFGIDMISNTPAGKLYNKNGLWHDASTNGRTEQSLAYFLPEDMELVVLANSPIGNPEQFFRSVVTQVYVDHIK